MCFLEKGEYSLVYTLKATRNTAHALHRCLLKALQCFLKCFCIITDRKLPAKNFQITLVQFIKHVGEILKCISNNLGFFFFIVLCKQSKTKNVHQIKLIAKVSSRDTLADIRKWPQKEKGGTASSSVWHSWANPAMIFCVKLVYLSLR